MRIETTPDLDEAAGALCTLQLGRVRFQLLARTKLKRTAERRRQQKLRFVGWDTELFYREVLAAEIAFVTVGYLRQLHAEGKRLPPRDSAPADVLCQPPQRPPDWASIFVVSWVWGADDHPDPHGARIARIVALLQEAEPDDVVFIDFISLHAPGRTSAGSTISRRHKMGRAKREAQQKLKLSAAAHSAVAAVGGLPPLEVHYSVATLCCSFLFTHRKARALVLTMCEETRPLACRFENRMVKVACLHCAAFCQRVMNMDEGSRLTMQLGT
jgi:hypothetical protein